MAVLAKRFTHILRLGDSRAADLLIDEALAADVAPGAIQSFVITPAMVRIGELWELGRLGVADEHLATSICQHALIRLFESMTSGRTRVRPHGSILLAAVEGQHHVLGLRMIADVMESAGYYVMYLGPDVPVASLRAFAAERQPALVGLGFGFASHVRRLANSIAAVHGVSPETRIMLGGRAVPAEFRSAYRFVATSVDVRSVVEELLASPAAPLPQLIESLRSDESFSSQDREDPGETDTVAARMSLAAERAVDLAREHFRRSEAYRELAFRDPLTDLANRRAFEDELSALSGHGGGAAAVLMIDVDQFKGVNDTLGHDAGDQVLREVARAISDSVRPGDIPARVGGDEFAVLLPATTIESARNVGERIRAAVADNPALMVSLSIGVASLANDSRVALLAADTALYQAKAAGRNRVVVSSRAAIA